MTRARSWVGRTLAIAMASTAIALPGSTPVSAGVAEAYVVAWGDDTYGQLSPPADLRGVKAVAAGANFAIALRTDGTIVAWGSDSRGQATPPSGLTGVTAIAAGRQHGLALLSNGTVVGWGANGDAPYPDDGRATPPAGLAGVVAIAAGWSHSLALLSNGTVVGWGANGPSPSQPDGRATPPEGLTGVTAIAAGGAHSLALLSNGTVVGWGNDANGQATPPSDLRDVTAISAGYNHSLAMRNDGWVVGWTMASQLPPASLATVRAISAGNSYSLAINSDGSIAAWGTDAYGRLAVPTVPAGVVVRGIAAGGTFGVAIFEPITFDIADVSVTEGDTGTATASITVSLSAPLPADASVQYATANDSATTSDYVPQSGTLQFASGETTKTLDVAVTGDLADEPDERFLVNLLTSSGAALGDAIAIGTIVDDDAAPVVSIDDATVTEGDSGVTEATFTVALSNPSASYVSVDFAVTDGTATAPSDYQARTGTRTFTPGQVSQSITVAVNGDTGFEADETFTVQLFDVVGATLGDATGTGTITNDDTAPAPPTLSIGDASLTEPKKNAPMVFTVTRSGSTSGTSTVAYATANGTATARSDYVAKSGTLTFSPGVSTLTISVTVRGDRAAEGDETVLVNLSSATGATIADGQGVGTIIDND